MCFRVSRSALCGCVSHLVVLFSSMAKAQQNGDAPPHFLRWSCRHALLLSRSHLTRPLHLKTAGARGLRRVYEVLQCAKSTPQILSVSFPFRADSPRTSGLCSQVPLLLLGGGGYTMRNVARCWTAETAVALGQKLDPHLPYTDYYEYFGPDYGLPITPSNMVRPPYPSFPAPWAICMVRS